jgi:hypothetical protein
MNFRKFLVAGALSCSLAFSSLAVTNQPVFAVEFSDTFGFSTETSINKLVSLGVMRHPGANFNPEGALTRAEFAHMVNQVMTLSTGKKVALKDLSSKNAAYTNTLKLINNGYLTVGKGYVKPSKGVTYAEMSKALSQGLGLKKTWTNRPVDFLFYLVRKEVLDIDTDLDAVVTREAAAVAFDKFITEKGLFTTDNGIVVAVTDKGFTLNNGSEFKTYTFASNVSPFVGGQAVTKAEVQIGSPATVVLNKKGTVAYYGGELLDAEENVIALDKSKWTIGVATATTPALVKDLNTEAFVAPLPNRANGEFSIKEIDTYTKAKGVTFSGQVFFTNTEEITAIYAWISKVEGKDITVTGNSVTVSITSAIKETFNVLEEAKVTLDGKDVKLADLKGALTATVEADKFGNVTAIAAVTKK